MKENKELKIAKRVSAVSILVNLLLSAFKLLAGLLAGSSAMISDAVHSASDVFSTIIVIIGISISSKESDHDHPYGHERLESVASILLAVTLGLTALGIGAAGVDKLQPSHRDALQIPGILALVAAVSSILVKEWMYWYTRAAAKKINSGALMADAWHHRSDALSSVGALLGIVGARMGYPLADPIASLIICLFIAKAAYDIFSDALDKMVDKSCPEKTLEEMRSIIMTIDGVEGIDDLKSRLFGARVYVDVEISVIGDKSLWEAHGIAQKVHDAIEEQIPNVKHCMVHENPV